MVQDRTEQSRPSLPRLLTKEEHDVDIRIGSQLPVPIPSQRHQATVLVPCDLRCLPGLPHGILISGNEQPVYKLRQGRHGVSRWDPFQQPLLERQPVPCQSGDRLGLHPAQPPWLRPVGRRHSHRALSPVSPVLIRNTESRSDTKILPSPTLPVFADREIVSITFCAILSATYNSIFTLGTKSVVYSAPR